MLRIHDPVEMEARPAEIVHRLLKADARVEEQLPCRAGDDERQRQRIEIDRPQDAFAANLLVEQDRQQQAKRQTEDHIEAAEQAHVDNRRVPVRRRIALERPVPKLLIVRPSDEVQVGERFRVGERKQEGPEIEPVDEDENQQKRRREHKPRQEIARAVADAATRAAHDRRRNGLGGRGHAHFLRAHAKRIGPSPPPAGKGGLVISRR